MPNPVLHTRKNRRELVEGTSTGHDPVLHRVYNPRELTPSCVSVGTAASEHDAVTLRLSMTHPPFTGLPILHILAIVLEPETFVS
jgi:hypothetical protein